jgi:hypothetical protein
VQHHWWWYVRNNARNFNRLEYSRLAGEIQIMLLLIVVPAFLMAALVVVLPKGRPGWIGKRTLIIGSSLIALLTLLWLMAIPEYDRATAGFVVETFFLPYLLTGIAGFLLQRGLRSSPVVLWQILVAVVLMSLVYMMIVDVTRIGLLSILLGILIAFSVSLMGMVIAIWLVLSLKGKHKLAALLPGLVFPMILVAGVAVGDSYSPESITQKNGDAIVKALQHYRNDRGTYPPDLSQLKPAYLSVLPEALTTQGTGWMYQLRDTEFTLGYWYYPAKDGSLVCLYRPSQTKWDCGANNWGPFPRVSTPAPSMLPSP